MFSKLSPFTLRNLSGAGRPKPAKTIDLADYTDPSTPPYPTGWAWCDSMQVWLPDDISFSSGLLFGNTLPCHRCLSPPPPTRPSLPYRLTSKDYWCRPRVGRKTRKNIRIVTDWYVVQASGATFSQIQLEALPSESCCGSSSSSLPRQYLF
ncbi:hypothetical protein BD413DRAFT_611374 [Trametes elegans]|nr:hypothetical protein BD413DRAFT_611374 [Trametes elegans]